MKNNYFLILSLISTLSFSQQVVKRITDTPTQTIVELFVLRNGTTLPNTTGNSNFNSGTSENTGAIAVYNPAISNTYSYQQLPSGTALHSTEQIGNGTFPFDGNQTYTLNNTNFIANGGSGATLPLLILEENGNADSTQDSNSITDLLYTKHYLPKTLTDGNPIPTGLIVKCLSRLGKDNNDGSTAISRRQVIFSFNGTTWIPILTDWLGVTPPALQEIDNNGQLLNINEFINNSKITIYPNPTNGLLNISESNYIINQINIYDMFGSLIKSEKNSNYNEKIDIQELPNAMYLIEVKTDKENRILKILKQ